MKNKLIFFVFLLSMNISNAYAATSNVGLPATIPVSQLSQFETYPPVTQKLITQALLLASLGLTYTYGSANPKVGGMDCSGTINYLLGEMAVKNVPRDANGQYEWTRAQGHFYSVNSYSLDSPEFIQLKPGDLLFWSGTYKTKANVLVSHVMLYLGKNLAGKPLMFGSSNGRTYEGIQRWGVSVFDFILPSSTSTSHFLGYSCIPTLTC